MISMSPQCKVLITLSMVFTTFSYSSTFHLWISITKAINGEPVKYYLGCKPDQAVKLKLDLPVIWNATTPMWRHGYEIARFRTTKNMLFIKNIFEVRYAALIQSLLEFIILLLTTLTTIEVTPNRQDRWSAEHPHWMQKQPPTPSRTFILQWNLSITTT